MTIVNVLAFIAFLCIGGAGLILCLLSLFRGQQVYVSYDDGETWNEV